MNQSTKKEPRERGSRDGYQVVFTVVTRRDGKKHWVKIGAAFRNRDGSTNVKLDAVPTNGELQLRTPDDSPQFRDSGRGFGAKRLAS